MHSIDETALAGLRASITGAVLQPGDDPYRDVRAAAVWNGDIGREPALIVQPATAQQVADALGFAQREGLDVTVRGGGHSFAGHAVCDGGLMIDLSGLADVAVDAAAQRARCGGGVTWAQLDAAAAAHGLAVPGGFISHTGVAGLTLGGGMGWLTRRLGLSCDNLVSAEVVTVDGRVVTASPQLHPDLFWALRGGGGNFGVVTTFEFALHEVAPVANLGLFFWRPDDARAPLQLARKLIDALPRGFGAFIGGLSAPPAPFVPPTDQGTPGFAVAIVNWGPAEEHASAVAPLRQLGPRFELMTPMPYVALQQMFDNSAPWGAYAYEKALSLDHLSDDVIDISIEHLPRKASPMSFTPIFPLGGAYADTGNDETAFGGDRRAGWVYNIAAIAPTPDLLDTDRAWVRDFWTALLPHSTGTGSYVNFLADPDQDRVRASYGEEKYARLAAIKTAWDPSNVLHHNANIRPAALSDA